MAKMETFQDLALAEPKSDQELWRWLYSEIRVAILDGRLKRGARLPSTRSLAMQYELARGTVVAAFEQLKTEGYIDSQRSAGTYVALDLPDQRSSHASHSFAPKQQSEASLSRRAQKWLSHSSVLRAPASIGKAFRAYEPAIDLFPIELWAKVASRVLRHAPRSFYGQGNPAGHQPLRRAIAEYLGSSRGVRCVPEQIIVTLGAQQALDLVARLLLDEGDKVWLEDPCYPGSSLTLQAAGASLVAVPVDQEGINVATGRRLAPSAKLAYVTPANQFPLGVTMSAKRRVDLLNWALTAKAWIIEDEYDAEYRYSGKPVASLHSMDRSGSVIYVGTFTKMLFNALRLGFVVLPERLVAAFEASRSFMDRHPPTLDQAILAEFITEGYFGHHVRRMRQVYTERMEVLKDAADRHLKGIVDVERATSGMRTIGWLKRGTSDKLAAQKAQRLGLETLPLSRFTLDHPQHPALILGFAGCNAGELRRGVTTLATALKPRNSVTSR